MFDRSWVNKSALLLALIATPIAMPVHAAIGGTSAQSTNGLIAQINQDPQQRQQELFRQQQQMQRQQLQDFRQQQQFNRQQIRLQQQQQQQQIRLQQQQQRLLLENYRRQQENR